LHLTFFANKTNTLKSAILTAHESPRYMLFAFFPLMFGSIFWGYLTKDMFIGLGSDFWQTSIFVLPQNQVFIDAEFLPITIKIIPLILSLSGMGFSFLVYYGYNNLNFLTINNNFLIYAKIISFLNKKWYFDLIYNQYIVKTYFFISYFITFKLIDRGVLEFFGPLGVVRQVDKISALTMKLHSGVIYRYVLLIILALLISLFIFF
jgi:NADH-ubiquinone oxidoreductase chain 5